jgi:hypothetical protein
MEIGQPRATKPTVGTRATVGITDCPTTQHPHRQIELRDSASGLQQFETPSTPAVDDDADHENKMSLLRRMNLSKS